MSKEGQLVKNTGILALGTLSSKFFTFLLLPLYTSVLSTSDLGKVDVIQSMISIAIPVVTLQLSIAVFRQIIEKESLDEKKYIISSAIIIVFLNTIIFSIIVLTLNYFFHIQYGYLFILSFFTSVISHLLLNVTRGFGHNIVYSLTNFLIIFSSLIFNLILILGFHMKGQSILISIFLSNALGAFFIIIKENLWKYLSFSYFKMGKLKEMLAFSLPYIPNALSWWVVNFSDRFVVLYFLGSDINGIYAAANKLPAIYITISSVFSAAWVESVSRNVTDVECVDFINKMSEKSFELLGTIALFVLSFISLFFNILIGKAYLSGYNHVYILLIAVFLNSMCSIYGGIFTGFKKTKIIGRTTIFGAILNIIITFGLIKVIGLYAASIATLISQLTVFMIWKSNAKKIIEIHWSRKLISQLACLFILVSIGYFLKIFFLNLIIGLILSAWFYLKEKSLITRFIKRVLIFPLTRNKLVKNYNHNH